MLSLQTAQLIPNPLRWSLNRPQSQQLITSIPLSRQRRRHVHHSLYRPWHNILLLLLLLRAHLNPNLLAYKVLQLPHHLHPKHNFPLPLLWPLLLVFHLQSNLNPYLLLPRTLPQPLRPLRWFNQLPLWSRTAVLFCLSLLHLLRPGINVPADQHMHDLWFLGISTTPWRTQEIHKDITGLSMY
jgi:hypothetical protein